MLSPADTKMAELCRTTAEGGAAAVQWLADNAAIVRQEHGLLAKDFRKHAIAARKLEAAVKRPMCVGVFGPSQAGKSYLISALARRGSAPLIAEFADRAIDFVREINPEGGQEATGLVTRFTLNKVQTPPGFPVALCLLSQLDIVKIIGNTYYADCDHSEWEPPAAEEIKARLDQAEAAAGPSAVDPLSEDDVYDLQEYFEKYFKGFERVKALRYNFWPRAAAIAPRLPGPARAKLFALIWGDVADFTNLYVRLYTALQQLGFSAEAFCPIESLTPRTDSIIDVRTLKGLGGDQPNKLAIRAPDGKQASLTRPEITALVAELTIVIRDKPWDFFDHTDLLDFPGARSREGIRNLDDFLEGDDALRGLFLRGKVAYLFERYCAEQELTSMLLCIGPSNQEVRTLPAMVKDWIDQTHGATPEERRKQENALFLVLTKFDMEFEEKAGQSDSVGRWTARMNTSLLDFFGKQDDWPASWTPGQPFNNTFWLRNPNFKAKHILDYDDAGLETGLRQGEEGRITQFKQDFLANPEILRHVGEPERKWDEAFRLNDGGIAFLAERLAPVCNPDLKRNQIAGRIAGLRRQMAERLTPYYVSSNIDEELAKKRAMARGVAQHLVQCAKLQRFGELLHELQVSEEDMHDLYFRVETTAPDDEQAAKPVASTIAIGSRADADEMLAELDLGADPPPAAAPGAPAPARDIDQAARFANAAVEQWIAQLHDVAEDARLHDYFRVPAPAMGGLVSELVTGGRRQRLEERIADGVRKATAFRMRLERVAAKPVRLATIVINDFVDWLGFELMDIARRPTVGKAPSLRPIFAPRPAVGEYPQLTEEPSRYDQVYYVDWISAFMRLAEDNVSFQSGAQVDLKENAKLGSILQSLREAAS